MSQYLPQQPTRSDHYASVDVSPGLVSDVHGRVTSYGWGGDTSHSARQPGSQHSVIGTLAGGASALLDSAKSAYSLYSAWSAQRQSQEHGSAVSYKPITSNQPNHRWPQNMQYSNQRELDGLGYHSQYGASAAVPGLSVDRFKSTSRLGRVIDGTLEGMFECMTCRCCCGGDGNSGPHATGGGDVSGGGGGGDCCACC